MWKSIFVSFLVSSFNLSAQTHLNLHHHRGMDQLYQGIDSTYEKNLVLKALDNIPSTVFTQSHVFECLYYFSHLEKPYYRHRFLTAISKIDPHAFQKVRKAYHALCTNHMTDFDKVFVLEALTQCPSKHFKKFVKTCQKFFPLCQNDTQKRMVIFSLAHVHVSHLGAFQKLFQKIQKKELSSEQKLNLLTVLAHQDPLNYHLFLRVYRFLEKRKDFLSKNDFIDTLCIFSHLSKQKVRELMDYFNTKEDLFSFIPIDALLLNRFENRMTIVDITTILDTLYDTYRLISYNDFNIRP